MASGSIIRGAHDTVGKRLAWGLNFLLTLQPSEIPMDEDAEARVADTNRGRKILLRALSKAPVLFWDKTAFVLGSTVLWVCAFWLGHSPDTFWKLYTVVGMVLFSARFAVYKKKKWHYYLLDFCYACNALLLAHLWLWPSNQLLARTTFAFNAGPLTTSIMAFRNSLVYHDMDKVTSLFLHLVPACVSWAQKWYADPVRFPRASYSGSAGLVELMAIPLAFYMVWAVGYSLLVFVFVAERIKRRGYTTLFTYVTTRKQGAYAAIARRVPTGLQPPVYFILHMAFCAVSLLLAVMAWNSYLVHTALLIAAASLAISNGAGYYFEVFAKRHRAPTVQDDIPPACQSDASMAPHKSKDD